MKRSIVERQTRPQYEQVEVTDDGRVSCRFSRPMKVDNDQFSVDLNNDWWQFYAWGPVSSGGALMRHSMESPPASEFKVTLSHRRNVISAASDSSALLYIYPIVCAFQILIGALYTGASSPT
ncbi:DOMON domain-containing protein FRRS1L [Lamellibrachia satsuma]|nr:DOMON domain-containing protein FRRS1L [Lamellibrachia satsuma]